MSEDLESSFTHPEIGDHTPLIVEALNLNGVHIRLISCDHQPEKLPVSDPWEVIEDQIEDSSLVYIEYFPQELERTVYNHPVWGWLARASGKTKGIDTFFNQVTDLCQKHDKEIAVADIANGPVYSAYHAGMRAMPAPLAAIIAPGEIGLVTGAICLLYGCGMNIQEIMRIGTFDLERKSFERFILDMEDGRRLLTARGIQQEAERRVKGSILTYIAPRAHVSRVKWFLENPEDLPTKIKAKLYSLFVGLPRSTRIYKNSKKRNYWQLVSDMKTE